MNELNLKETRINGIYQILKKVGAGAFGQVFIAINTETNELTSLKFEEAKKNDALSAESKIIQGLEGGTGIPKMYWYGTDPYMTGFVIMATEMLGPNLEDQFLMCNRTFKLKTILMLMDQIISRLEFVHNNHLIHRDIKPENFLMGLNTRSAMVHIIDFGLAKRYRDPRTLHHIPFKEGKSQTGTARYASVNSHLGIEMSRRDDLECVSYLLLYFLTGTLPWQKQKANNRTEKYHKIMTTKLTLPVEVMTRGLPEEFSRYMNYVKSQKFEDRPDYSYQKKQFRDLFNQEGYVLDYQYDWCLEENTTKTLENVNDQKKTLQTVQISKDSYADLLGGDAKMNTLFQKPNGETNNEEANADEPADQLNLNGWNEDNQLEGDNQEITEPQF